MTSDSSKNGTRLLDGVRGPADVNAIREQDLPRLAPEGGEGLDKGLPANRGQDWPRLPQEVREELIKVLSQTGGHLGPNLGVVELTIALHRVFDTPMDPFIFDTGHQSYVHKILTGRKDLFGTLRQGHGLSGYPN